MSLHIHRNTFNAGEISPLMDSRVDVEKYASSCRRLENFIPRVYGGAFRRPGTEYIGQGGYVGAGFDDSIRLVPFNFSASVRYVLEMSSAPGGFIRIWNANGTLVESDESPFPVWFFQAPWTKDTIDEVQVAQLGNIAYFTHPSFSPRRLIRSVNAANGRVRFQWAAMDPSFPPFQDFNQSAITATPSATTGTGITITLSGDSLNAWALSQYAGAQILLSQRRSAAHQKLALSSGTGSSSAISVLGTYEVYTFGTYTGTVSVEAQDATGAWKVIRTFEAISDRQIVFRSAVEETTSIRITKNTSAASTNATAYIEVGDSRRLGYADITNAVRVGSTIELTAAVVLPFDSTAATTDWALSAWGPGQGYPRAVAFHEQRLWFAGTANQPATFWASKINDFENFRRGAFDDDALSFTLAAAEGSAVQSMLSHEALILFTQGEEWTATTSEQTAITPSNIFVRRQSRYGSAYRQAFLANKNILFLQRGNRKLRELRYAAMGQDSGTGSDLTMIAEHVTRSGIRQMGFSSAPDPVLWAVTNDGELLSMTFEADQGVIAWARHRTAGTFESVAVIYGDEFGGDDVWVATKRTLNGVERYHVERLDSDAFALVESGRWDEAIYADAAKRFSYGSPRTVIDGLTHLEGETVYGIADGSAFPETVVVGGEITLPFPASKVVVGLPYSSLLQPSRVELEMRSGTAQSRKWLCKRVALNLWETFGIEYADSPGEEEDHWFPATLTDTEAPLEGGTPLVTGRVEVVNLGAHRESVDFSVRQRLPFPAAILAMVPKIEVTGT